MLFMHKWRKSCVLASLVLILLILAGCSSIQGVMRPNSESAQETTSTEESTPSSEELSPEPATIQTEITQPQEFASPKIASVTITSSSLLRNSEGVPTAIRSVAEAVLTVPQNYQCRHAYAGEVTGSAIGRSLSNSPFTLITAIENKHDIGKWKVCCTLDTETEFTTLDSAVCS